MIDISESAQVYLKGLLENQETEGTAIRIFVAQPGTPQAETCIAYAKEDENFDDSVSYTHLTLPTSDLV